MYWIPAFIILGISLYWHYWRRKHKRMLQLAELIPGPPAYPIIGNGLLFMLNTGEQMLDLVAELLNTYGEYCKFWLGPDLNIVVRNPADIRLLLTSNKVNEKGPLYEFMKPLVGPGILTGGPTWRNHRKIATPSYNKKAVHEFATLFNKEADILADILSKKDLNKTFNVYFDVVECTTQCVCQTLMGLSKKDTQNLKNLKEVVLLTQRMYDTIFVNMTKWWYHIPMVRWVTGRQRTENYFKKITDELSADIVSKRRKAIANNGVVDDDSLGIVDRYILSKELSEQEIKWETFSLFTTSQEASAKIASAVLLFLAHLPEWQEKVYNEIIEVLGVDDSHVSNDDLKSLNNLDMVYKEVLRYLSIAAFIQRTVEEEISINDGKITLPVGTSLVIPIHEVHRDPRHWDEPLKVKPERFLPENVKTRDPNAFIPFSLGAMDCLGRVYATALIKTLVVKVLRRVNLEAQGAIEDLKLHVAISVKFADGYNLRVKPRKNGSM
ncbi:cytochrome P450 4g15 isoform X1 [Manduca sexta]|uniref:cytochrome P450 4g15 isoform X1 n=2 Tax=Manduca sexta TaxID=7130 RepID=UPI00188F4DB2|nr:cytochrome P450 4g15 isoform X1 [Manduca sexta]